MIDRSLRSSGWIVAVLGLAASATAQELDRLEGPDLIAVPTTVEPAASLTIPQLAAMPTPFRGTRSPAIVVQTDRGNLARLIVVPAFRKPASGEGEPFPVAIIERFETFENPGGRNRLAQGRNITLFHGLPIDLDSGQIVPQGEGGDLQFDTNGEPRLSVVEPTRMFPLKTSPLPPASGSAAKPASGRLVRPDDFQGRYRLFANGQWSGLLDLIVHDGDVTGSFRSDQTGSSYPVAGQTGSPANRIQFHITMPRTHLDYEGYLFSDGKGAIAGTFRLLNRPYGFVALRERGTISPEGDEADAIAAKPDASLDRNLTIALKGGRYRLGDREIDLDGLAKAVADAVRDEPDSAVLIRVASDEPYKNVEALVSRIRESGIDSIRLTTAEPER